MSERKLMRNTVGAILVLWLCVFVGGLTFSFLSSCSKTTNVTGPGDTDTLIVTRVDTLEVTIVDTIEVTKIGVFDYYAGLQTWINDQLSPMVSYYPTIGTEDVIVTNVSAKKKRFDVYWIVIDFQTMDVWAYAGVFDVELTGTTFTVTEVTGQGSPKRVSKFETKRL